MELIEHVRIAPVEQQTALPQIEACAVAACDLLRMQRSAEAVEIHDAASAQLIQVLALGVRYEGEKSIECRQTELLQHHRRLAPGEVCSECRKILAALVAGKRKG